MDKGIEALIADMKAAAEKATPGQWVYLPKNTSIEYDVGSDDHQGSITYMDSGDFTQKITDLNGAHVAAANPENVLKLIAALTSGCGFFAYDPDNGFEEFKTKDEAIEAAESYIDYYRGDACDGWADEVSQVSWGVVMQQSTKVDERPKNAEDSVSDYIETVCDFALLPAIITPTTDAAIASIKVQARIEGAHFVANRMLAAWEAGFIEDTAKNAADIARMILTSTEFMPTAPEGDFDRSFADGVLVDISAQLRKESSL